MRILILLSLLVSSYVLADNVLLVVPQNQKPGNLPAPVKEALQSVNAIRMGGYARHDASGNVLKEAPNLSGTQVFNGKKLVMYNIDDMTVDTLEAMISSQGQTWQVIGHQSNLADASGNAVSQRKPSQATLDDYLTVDASNNQSKLPCFQGHACY